MYFRTRAGQAQEHVVVLVGRRLPIAFQPDEVQSQSAGRVAEGDENMDQTHARFVGLDDRLRKSDLSLELLQATFCLG